MKKSFFVAALLPVLLSFSCSKSPAPPPGQETPALSAEATPLEIPMTPNGESVQAVSSETPPSDVPDVATQNLPLSDSSGPQTLQYVLDDMKGTVQMIPKGSTRPQAAEEEDSVEEGDTVITGPGSEATLTLNENTMFRMSENSRVTIGQLTPNASKGFLSRLKLLGGKILSEVENLTQSHSTFEVESGGVVCGVRGTAFEVVNNGADVQTNTFHGLVEVQSGQAVQQVGAEQAVAFSFNRRAFLAKRALTLSDRDRYQAWQQFRPQVRERVTRRAEVFRAAAQLPPAERARIFNEAGQGGRHKRLKLMRLRYQKMREEGHLRIPETLHSKTLQGPGNRGLGIEPKRFSNQNQSRLERERGSSRPQTRAPFQGRKVPAPKTQRTGSTFPSAQNRAPVNAHAAPGAMKGPDPNGSRPAFGNAFKKPQGVFPPRGPGIKRQAPPSKPKPGKDQGLENLRNLFGQATAKNQKPGISPKGKPAFNFKKKPTGKKPPEKEKKKVEEKPAL